MDAPFFQPKVNGNRLDCSQRVNCIIQMQPLLVHSFKHYVTNQSFTIHNFSFPHTMRLLQREIGREERNKTMFVWFRLSVLKKAIIPIAVLGFNFPFCHLCVSHLVCSTV